MTQPTVVTLFKVYVGFMVLMYIIAMGIGILFLAAPDLMVDPHVDGSNRSTDGLETLVMGIGYTGVGSVLAVLHSVAFFTPQRRWGWVYNLVLIAFGMTSCCLLPATLPMLFYWLKPEVKAWYQIEERRELGGWDGPASE